MKVTVLAQYAKAVCGAIVAGGGAAATAAADGRISLAEGCLIAVAFFGTLGGVSAVKNTLSPKQLMAQPGYTPAIAHVPMPLVPDAPLSPQTNLPAAVTGGQNVAVIVPDVSDAPVKVATADSVLAALDKVTLARLQANAQRRHQTVEDDAARIITAYFK